MWTTRGVCASASYESPAIPARLHDEVFGENLLDSNTEYASLLTPTNPCAATKAGTELLVMAYGCSYGLPHIITRGNNV